MPIEIVYTIADRRNRKSTTSVKVADGLNETTVTGFATSWADAIDNLINGVIRAASAILHVDISAISGNVAASSSDVEEIASFQFRTDSGQFVEVNIPSFVETYFNNDTGLVDQSVSDVADFISLMEDGMTIGATLVEPCDVGGDDLVATVYAKERSRASGTRKKT